MNRQTLPPSLVWGVFDTLSTPIAILNQTGQIVTTNQTWNSSVNDPRWPTVVCHQGENYLERCTLTPDGIQPDLTPIATALAGMLNEHHSETTLEYPCLIDLKPEWYQTHINHWQEGEQIYLFVSHKNITATKLVEQGKSYEAQVLGAIVESSRDMIATIDRTGHLLYINPAGRLLLECI